jgi:hypothetical protein
MTQTQALIILGVIPYKFNRLIKTVTEAKADNKESEKKALKRQFNASMLASGSAQPVKVPSDFFKLDTYRKKYSTNQSFMRFYKE